mmetsp:Transcript_20007/g.50136  ORF Transcript_20007/g.50136 Transcript_20007/m.50136 type:complete len:210 (+) Transcript_20007:464-1093(+)
MPTPLSVAPKKACSTYFDLIHASRLDKSDEVEGLAKREGTCCSQIPFARSLPITRMNSTSSIVQESRVVDRTRETWVPSCRCTAAQRTHTNVPQLTTAHGVGSEPTQSQHLSLPGRRETSAIAVRGSSSGGFSGGSPLSDPGSSARFVLGQSSRGATEGMRMCCAARGRSAKARRGRLLCTKRALHRGAGALQMSHNCGWYLNAVPGDR